MKMLPKSVFLSVLIRLVLSENYKQDKLDQRSQCVKFETINDLQISLAKNDVVAVAFADMIGPGSSMLCSNALHQVFNGVVFGVTDNASVADHFGASAGIISPSVMLFMDFGKTRESMDANILDDYIHVYGQTAGQQ
jgi:hypothetical protein